MDVPELLNNIYDVIMKPVIGLLFGVAFVVFAYGVLQFIAKRDDDKGREDGKKSIIYGIIGMVIMVSVFGIIRIITGTIGVENPIPAGITDTDIFPEVEGGL